MSRVSSRHLVDPQLFPLLESFPTVDLTVEFLPFMRSRPARCNHETGQRRHSFPAAIARAVPLARVHGGARDGAWIGRLRDALDR